MYIFTKILILYVNYSNIDAECNNIYIYIYTILRVYRLFRGYDAATICRALIAIKYQPGKKLPPFLPWYFVAQRPRKPHQRSRYLENRNDFKRLIEIDSVIYCV